MVREKAFDTSPSQSTAWASRKPAHEQKAVFFVLFLLLASALLEHLTTAPCNRPDDASARHPFVCEVCDCMCAIGQDCSPFRPRPNLGNWPIRPLRPKLPPSLQRLSLYVFPSAQLSCPRPKSWATGKPDSGDPCRVRAESNCTDRECLLTWHTRHLVAVIGAFARGWGPSPQQATGPDCAATPWCGQS